MSTAQANKNTDQQPKTMGNERRRESRFEWLRQFPTLNFPRSAKSGFTLISDEDLSVMIQRMGMASDSEAVKRVKRDLELLDVELMPLFRERDYAAKREQNRYRLYQLSFLMLAMLATTVGSFQVWALQSAPRAILYLGLTETIIALFTTFVATLMGNQQPLGTWLENRRLAEQLRREYYLFLTDQQPYDALEGPKRATRLARRAAAINNRKDPDSIIN